jgi:pre-peptidase
MGILGLCALAPAGAQTAWPRITSVTPTGGQRGTTVEVSVAGVNIGRGTGLLFEGTGLTVEAVTPEKPAPPAPAGKEGEKPPEPPKNPEGRLTARVRIAPDAAPGIRALRVLTPLGPSDLASFAVGQWPEVAEKEPNGTREQAQAVQFPVTVNGRIDPGEDVDLFRFKGQAGQTLVFEVLAARLGSPLDSILSLQDAGGREIALNEDYDGPDSLLAFTLPATGDYFLALRDLRYQGGGNFGYRLSMGEIPFVTAAFPMGGPAGATVPMELTGFNLGAARSMPVTLPAGAVPGTLPLALSLPAGASNPITLVVGDGPELTEVEPNDEPAKAQPVTPLATINGRIEPAGASTGPDVDCFRFHAEKDQKLVLEVLARRLGSELDSLLSVTDAAGKELAVNDDAVGKDSRLEFTAPEAGDYVARVSDLEERGGPRFTYRLRIAPAVPEFRLTFAPDRLAVGRGGRAPLTVTAERLFGFDGEIALEISGLPPGVSVIGPARIRAGQKEANVVLAATADASIQATAFTVSGTATLDGRTVRHAGRGLEEFTQDNEKRTRPSELLTAAATEPPDMVVTATPETLTLAAGKSVEIAVKVARKDGFKAKVPLAVLGLPEGISVEAPEIAEDKNEGKITLKAGGDVKPGEVEIVVAGRTVIDDQRQVPHVAVPITLTVVVEKKG